MHFQPLRPLKPLKPLNHEQDRSLDDIRAVLSPAFAPPEVRALDTSVTWARALDGSEYMPGLVGLNNMKANDYANVVIQARARGSRCFACRPRFPLRLRGCFLGPILGCRRCASAVLVLPP